MDRVPATELQPSDGAEDWWVTGGRADAWFAAPSQSAGAALVTRIAELTNDTALPDINLRADGVRVRIGERHPHLSNTDIADARVVSAAARDLGLAADSAALQCVGLTIDTADRRTATSFWRAVLGYEPVGDDVLTDPMRRDPVVSFRRLEQPRPLRNRIHVDVVRTPDAVASVRAAVGGEPYGCFGLTLADAERNEVDLIADDALSEGPETADWRVLFGAMAFYPTTSAAQGSRLVTVAAGLADDAGMPLLMDMRPGGVTIDSGKDQWEDDGHGYAARFADLAGRVQTAAHDLGLTADPVGLRFVQFGIDAVDVPAVRSFWASVLGYQLDPRTHVTDIYDPRRLDPVIIFQQMDAAERDRLRQRNRIHLELCVPFDQADARVDAALAAGGGQVISDRPGRRTLADPEGNEVVIVAQ